MATNGDVQVSNFRQRLVDIVYSKSCTPEQVQDFYSDYAEEAHQVSCVMLFF